MFSQQKLMKKIYLRGLLQPFDIVIKVIDDYKESLYRCRKIGDAEITFYTDLSVTTYFGPEIDNYQQKKKKNEVPGDMYFCFTDTIGFMLNLRLK